MEINFLRSKALNNIPNSKIQEKLNSITLGCEECKTKHISDGDILCSKCRDKIEAINRYSESNIPIEYWKLNIEKNFDGDKKLLEKYYEITKELVRTFELGTSLCLCGNHGQGKTYFATSLLKKAALKNYTCLYTTLSDVVSALTQSYNDKHDSRKELTMVDFLVIDECDLRFFNQSDNSTELFGRTFESILRTRLQNRLPTIMATNSPNLKENFNSLFKNSLGSLLNKVEFFIILPGPDFREIK
jgi:DNA replication protein DnaC